MSGNLCRKGGGGGVGRLMANAILNFHFDYPHPSLIQTSRFFCELQTTKNIFPAATARRDLPSKEDPAMMLTNVLKG